MDGGTAGSLNFSACVQGCRPSPAATEEGFVRAAKLPGGASSSESELSSWWVYWWISFSLRIIRRFGKGRTPNLRGAESGVTARGAAGYAPSDYKQEQTDLLSLFLSSGVSMSE